MTSDRDPPPPPRRPSSASLSTSILKRQLAKTRIQVRIADLLDVLDEVRGEIAADGQLRAIVDELERVARATLAWIKSSND